MEKLTDRIRIFSLLKRLKEERALLGVTIEGNEQEFNSAILDLSLDDNYFMLDELKPKEGHALLNQHRYCLIKGQAQGIHLQFHATIKKVNEDQEISYYIADNPRTLEYMQRRSSVRVHIGAATPVPVSIRSETGETLEGELKDLSAGGLGLRFSKSIPSQFEVGQKLECAFRSPMDLSEQFVCDVDIRLIKRQAEPADPAYMGCQFVGLVSQQQRQIERMVMALQRLAQKRRSNT